MISKGTAGGILSTVSTAGTNVVDSVNSQLTQFQSLIPNDYLHDFHYLSRKEILFLGSLQTDSFELIFALN